MDWDRVWEIALATVLAQLVFAVLLAFIGWTSQQEMVSEIRAAFDSDPPTFT